MKTFIKEMISEGGRESTTRFGYINMVGMVWMIIICLMVMIFLKIISITVYEAIALIGTISGVFSALKYAQKRVEGVSKSEKEKEENEKINDIENKTEGING